MPLPARSRLRACEGTGFAGCCAARPMGNSLRPAPGPPVLVKAGVIPAVIDRNPCQRPPGTSSPACGGGRVRGRLRASGSGRRSLAKVRHTERPSPAPPAEPTGFTHLGPVPLPQPVVVACKRYPNRLPSRKRGPPRIAVRGRPRILQSVARTARSGDPGPIPDSRGSPGRFARLRRLRRQRITPPSFGSPRSARHRKSGMGPRLRGDDEKGAKARAARTAGALQTSRNEMCARGRPPSRGPASVLAAAPDRGPGQSDQLSTGCGGGAERRHRLIRRVPRGIGSQGWVPAFAGTTPAFARAGEGG